METFWDKMLYIYIYIYIMMYFFPYAILSLTFYPFIYLFIYGSCYHAVNLFGVLKQHHETHVVTPLL